MKIVYVLAANWGAIPRITAELANAISQHADVIVLKPKDNLNFLFSQNVRIVEAFEPIIFDRNNYLSSLSRQNFKAILSYKNLNLINELRPDIVVLQEVYPYSGIFLWLYRIHNKYPLVFYASTAFNSVFVLQEGFLYSAIATLNECVKRIISPAKFIVEREEVRNVLVRRGISPKNIAVIPLGIPSVRVYLEPAENRVLLFGSLVEGKGVEYFIEAVQIAAKEVPVIGTIAGPGNFSKYKKYIKNPELFEIHNRYMPETEIPKIFASSKVVVLPYYSDDPKAGGQSGVLPLAFSFGKPVIVSNLGRFLELIEDGKEGLIVPQRDPKALADAIVRLLRDDEMRARMRENVLKKAKELSWDNIAKKHLEVYESVLYEWNERERS